MARRMQARVTSRLQVMGHSHDDDEASVAKQIGMLDHIVALAEDRYGEFNPTRVQQLRDHVAVVESFLEALYTETPYTPLSHYADDDPRLVELQVIRDQGFEGWRRLRRG